MACLVSEITIGALPCDILDEGDQAVGVRLYVVAPVCPFMLDGRVVSWVGSGATVADAIASARHFVERHDIGEAPPYDAADTIDPAYALFAAE